MIFCRATGNSHVVLWAPGSVEPANRNLEPEDPKRFVGLGPFRAKGASAVTLRPGESHALTLELSSAPAPNLPPTVRRSGSVPVKRMDVPVDVALCRGSCGIMSGQ